MLLCIDNSIVCNGKLSGVYRVPKGSVKRASFIFKCQSVTLLKKQSQKGLLKIPCVGSIYFSPSYEIAGLAKFININI